VATGIEKLHRRHTCAACATCSDLSKFPLPLLLASFFFFSCAFLTIGSLTSTHTHACAFVCAFERQRYRTDEFIPKGFSDLPLASAPSLCPSCAGGDAPHL
jgi:hypothetical protein